MTLVKLTIKKVILDTGRITRSSFKLPEGQDKECCGSCRPFWERGNVAIKRNQPLNVP